MGDIRGLLMRHEGMRLRPYLDTKGKITIGVGRNLEDVGITTDEAFYLLDKDVTRATAAAATFAWFPALDTVRKDVIISMVFNMGLTRFAEFKRLIEALEKSDFEQAAKEMLQSQWAAQVKDRAAELARMMRTAKYAE